MNCPKCGIENPDGANFCLRCGKALVDEAVLQGESGELTCYRHPKTPTQLTCGRCGRPVCTRCVVLGPAGPRCPECAHQQVTVRPGAVFHSLKVGVRRLFQSGPWTIYLFIILIGFVASTFRGCAGAMGPRHPAQERRSESTDDP
ncbi:MAG: zinc-ribbon domain-containing protein [Armatimonadetes bacterium]|nr:zinc-ribbon domain-containing protein [Armatimonadota bacterium]